VSTRTSTIRDRTELASAVREYIAGSSGSRTLSLAEVAEVHNVSCRTLQRALASDATDYSRLLRIARMDFAARFLSRTHGSVADAWMRSGYRSQAHFTRTFASYFGITPRKYRRIAVLEGRLSWRDWKDQIDPARPGSSEYFRRRKRRSENVRELQRLTRGLLPNARAALTDYAPPQRPVIDLEAARRARASRRERVRARVLEELMDEPW
jgi:AraC-like DNA-binding protein